MTDAEWAKLLERAEREREHAVRLHANMTREWHAVVQERDALQRGFDDARAALARSEERARGLEELAASYEGLDAMTCGGDVPAITVARRLRALLAAHAPSVPTGRGADESRCTEVSLDADLGQCRLPVGHEGLHDYEPEPAAPGPVVGRCGKCGGDLEEQHTPDGGGNYFRCKTCGCLGYLFAPPAPTPPGAATPAGGEETKP